MSPKNRCNKMISLKDVFIRVAGVEEESIVDGPGIRFVLFVQGCATHCPGCQNPQTWDFSGGSLISAYEILERIVRNPMIHGVTFSGGEPFEQAKLLTPLATELKKRGFHLMSFTGFTWERIVENPEWRDFLSLLDILVDGPFVQAEKSLELNFRGSKNQRILDVPAGLRQGKAVLHELNDFA